MPRVAAEAPPSDFSAVYGDWFDEVLRWLPAMGVPEHDLEDVAQEVFLVVRRKLHAFDGGNLPGWIYAIAQRIARDHRRRAWFRRLFLRPREVPLEQLPDGAHSPFELVERKEMQGLLAAIVAGMSDKRRQAFVLYEIEGYSGEEIAALAGVPLATVWTRLHHARKDFVAAVARMRRRGEVS
jgi:RNA polymerase sigma-70 factor (ECF subfamily)